MKHKSFWLELAIEATKVKSSFFICNEIGERKGYQSSEYEAFKDIFEPNDNPYHKGAWFSYDRYEDGALGKNISYKQANDDRVIALLLMYEMYDKHR